MWHDRLILISSFAVIGWLGATAAEERPQRELRLPDPPDRYVDAALPAHFLTPDAKTFDNTPADNPQTDAGVLLGRVLFYDTRLSASGTVSCGSCHVQQHAFTDPRRFSEGHAGRKTDRNSMSLVNLRFSKAGKFWDERVATLEEQVLIPLQSRVEMGQTLDGLVEVLGADDRYRPLFEQAFGDAMISAERAAKALAQFLRALVSSSSKYDAGLAAVKSETDDFPNFTAAENLGKTLFLEKCAICHRDGRGRQSAFFTSFRSLNNGVDETADAPDAGAGDVTLIPGDIGLFRPSDLRNVEFTAPYMHDGRFATLEEVVEHYSTGVKRHPNVSGFAFRMNFTPEEKSALVAFLKTLSDESFLHDPRFGDPWIDRSPSSIQATASTEPSPQAVSNESPRLTAEERAERLAQHRGLPRGEAYFYLLDLDRNGDHALTRDETAPLAELLLVNGPPSRFDRRRFAPRSLQIARGSEAPPAMMALDRNQDGQLASEEFPDDRHYVLRAADLDGDGRLSIDEARRFETVERFIAAQAGERDRTRMTRLLESLRLQAEQAEAVRLAIQRTQQELQTAKDQADRELTAQLAAALDAASFARFQELMLVNQDAQELSRRAGGITAASIQRQIFEFDDDRDERLNAQELATLAAVLDETAGGFGTARPPMPSIQQFSRRMMARDADGDDALSLAELPERLTFLWERGDADRDARLSRAELDAYLRNTSFDRFLAEGIYQAGTFLNAFTNSARLLDQLELPEDRRRAVRDLIETHERRIQETVRQAVVTAYELLKAESAR